MAVVIAGCAENGAFSTPGTEYEISASDLGEPGRVPGNSEVAREAARLCPDGYERLQVGEEIINTDDFVNRTATEVRTITFMRIRCR